MTHRDPQLPPPRGRERYPLARPFPQPGRGIRLAYRELDLALNGDDEQRTAIGDPAQLPRPWDPGSIESIPLRIELWEWLEAVVEWLEAVVEWINTEHVWDPSHHVPACWPQHPHLVHEIAVLADQRHKAGQAIHSDALEEWHRYALPAFFDRRRARVQTTCDCRHHDWPARPGHGRFQQQEADRKQQYAGDIDHTRRLAAPPRAGPVQPRLHLIDGQSVDPSTGEVL